MQCEISSTMFEWLLADWAGHGEKPGEVFTHLRDVAVQDLEEELEEVVHRACAAH